MRIIVVSADDNLDRLNTLSAYLKANYKIAYAFISDTKNAKYTRDVIGFTVDSEMFPNLKPKMKKNAFLNYNDTKHLLTDIDLSTRSESYKKIFESAHYESDAQLNEKLLEFYAMVTNKLELINSHESISLRAIADGSADVAIICDPYIANSLIEAIYKINKYHAYTRSVENDINKIHANISVINTHSKLLEFYNYSKFL